ncbi:MAG TPA: hypothetical protein VGO22_18765, partial [Pseudorhizobium sp.]|nr:hypothetical protein [Pseudorhizobium sp.]
MKHERFYQHAYSDPLERVVWEPMLQKTTTHYPIARRDPIFTPLFTSFFTTVGFSATTAAFLGAATTAIATTALSIGIQALLAPKPPKPEDGKIPKVQSIPYRQWAVGTNRLAGAYMLWEAKGKDLIAVQAIAGHRIHAVKKYWLHDHEVQLNSNGRTINTGADRYRDRVLIAHRLGLPTETPYADVVSRLSGEGIWTNNHRGDGQASLAMIATSDKAEKQSARFPYGPPSLSVEADCAIVFDYRISSDPTNEAAWVFSKNSALIMAWHQCFSEFGHRRDFTRAILPVLDMWIEEANICDEDVELNGGGTEKRYECNG